MGGFGFLERDDGGDDLFVHFSSLTNGGSEDMVVGMKVTFDEGYSERSGKSCASNVTITQRGTGGGGGSYGKSGGYSKGGRDDGKGGYGKSGGYARDDGYGKGNGKSYSP